MIGADSSLELSLKMFATLIDVNLTRYAHALPKYDIIEFIEFAEKCVKDELKSAPRWCHTLAHDNDDE